MPRNRTPRRSVESVETKQWWHSPTFAAIVAGLLGIAGLVIGNNIRIGSLQFGGTVFDSPSTKLVPRTSVCFWHGNSPAGYRLTTAVGDGTWIERQPDGMEYHHLEVGRISQGPIQGVVLTRKENPKDEPWYVETLIPDIGANNVLMYRPDPKSAWEYVSVLEPTTENCPRLDSNPPKSVTGNRKPN